MGGDGKELRDQREGEEVEGGGGAGVLAASRRRGRIRGTRSQDQVRRQALCTRPCRRVSATCQRDEAAATR